MNKHDFGFHVYTEVGQFGMGQMCSRVEARYCAVAQDSALLHFNYSNRGQSSKYEWICGEISGLVGLS